MTSIRAGSSILNRVSGILRIFPGSQITIASPTVRRVSTCLAVPLAAPLS